MSDHEQIRNLLGQYCHSVDSWDLEAYASLMIEDAVINVNGNVLTPRREIVDTIRKNKAAAADSTVSEDKHLTLNSVISTEGDTASAVSDLVMLSLDEAGWRITLAGRYVDEIVRTAAGWKFASRTITLRGPVG